jgi:hypothetical protein
MHQGSYSRQWADDPSGLETNAQWTLSLSSKQLHRAPLSTTVVEYVGIGSQWYRRLVELGIDDKEGSLSVLEYVGKKQVLEVVESNNLAQEFCWITRLLAE